MIKDSFKSSCPTILFIAALSDDRIKMFFKDEDDYVQLTFKVIRGGWRSSWEVSYTIERNKTFDFDIPVDAKFFITKDKTVEFGKKLCYRLCNEADTKGTFEYNNIFCYNSNNLGIAKDVKLVMLNELVDTISKEVSEDVADDILAVPKFLKFYQYEKSIVKLVE